MMGSEISYSTPLKIGQITLKNRVVMAAMTRCRADVKTGIPNDLMVEYYSQRAGAGLILSQCSSWSQRGIGFPGAGQIYNKEQAQGWKKVTDTVHSKGGLIFLQIFHAGRASDPGINGGLDHWAPSPIAIRGGKIHALGGKSYQTPTEMTLENIKETQAEFEKSLQLAKEANFDGIELHGANGYLVDQFLRSQTNQRTDSYGGCPQNRARFALELIDIALKHYKPYQIGIKLSPIGRYNDMFDQNPHQIYSYLLKQLSQRKIGFVEIMQAPDKEIGDLNGNPPGKEQMPDAIKTLKPFFDGVIIGNLEFTPEAGLKKIRAEECDAISFARLYITNPDLTERIFNDYPLDQKLDPATLYFGQKAGYSDYSNYKAA